MTIAQQVQTNPQGMTIVVLSPVGRLDIMTAKQFRDTLQDCIRGQSPHIVVNLGQANFIDSSGLSALVAGMRATAVQGSFRLCNVHPEAKLVFEVTMMDAVFEMFDTESDALSKLYELN